jgi:multidrug resistance efflux pump
MIPRIRPTRVLIALVLAVAHRQAPATVLTGEVRSVGAQALITPQSNSSPVVIRFFVPEGEAVKAGDVVLRIDPGQSASMIPDLEAQIDQARAKAAKEVAELEVKALDAELERVDADSALATARLDARIPRELISGLDYDRYQGELERTSREAALAASSLADARSAVTRRLEQGRLEVRKLDVQLAYHRLLVRSSEVRADRDGIVLHGFNNNWIGGRIDEGSSAMPGSKAGEVVGRGRMNVRAWALEPDRPGLDVGQPVELAFDALPGRRASGRIASIAGAPERRPEWGDGRYFVVEIDITAGGQALPLLPGMSVRVTARPRVGTAKADTAANPGAAR